ncbi:hypothetical protein OVA03_04600 [Asticcacaulis sp. SL142]|uniref:hypothetical protein n=1 Tax=Asticcacaulis sp. SL142 TaxID=2995155 RepID=UPI00226C8A91|nr:hypothetical protein [Asticcacaulis sp. SL142]WAC49198.1 hypothetical protein OVA03_04600 [Asticcacaulis sp. SL142]
MTAPVFATVTTERSANGHPTYDIDFDLDGDIKIDIPGPFGPVPISERESDLLDIAIAVHFLERDQRKKAESNRVRLIDATLPVRDPAFWAGQADKVASLLRWMGGIDWRVSFVQSTASVRTAAKTVTDRARTIVLNSGGMDSTCGLSGLMSQASSVRLASFYTLNSNIQKDIASSLGFEKPSQMRAVWRVRNERRGNGALSYRSFLFLTFGAIVARSFDADRLLQFENGVMARAVTPAASYFTTRHAHPRTHRLFGELVGAIGLNLTIENPFKDMTKGEEVEVCRQNLSGKADALLKGTDSCWYFHYVRVPVRFGSGAIDKTPRRHCGICVPCLVRRAAFGDTDYVYDPSHPPKIANSSGVDPRSFTYNLDAMKRFAEIVLATQDGPTFRRAMSANAIDIDPETGTWDELQSLYSRFATEFSKQFP